MSDVNWRDPEQLYSFLNGKGEILVKIKVDGSDLVVLDFVSSVYFDGCEYLLATRSDCVIYEWAFV